MILYHGSPISGLKEIKASNEKNHDGKNDSRIYLTPSYPFAACYTIPWHDGNAHQEVINGEVCFEIKNDNILKFHPGSIYMVDVNELQLEKISNHEYYIKGKQSLKVINETPIDDFIHVLKQLGVNISYGE